MISLSPELAEIYRTDKTGSKLFAMLCKSFENRSNAISAFYDVQRLEEELRRMRYHTEDDIEDHLRQIRNKKLELVDNGSKLSFTTIMMYTLQSLPSAVHEF